MKRILILGAGRSSASLIHYLLRNAQVNDWMVTVGDIAEGSAHERIGGNGRGAFIFFDIKNESSSRVAIKEADVVISLLPAHFHPVVAKICLDEGKHLLTASYVSPEMAEYNSLAVEKGLLLLNECGLDPGIDHMSAMQIIDRIRDTGGKIVSFESFTGGLIAPATDPGNPWRYKFTWNPRNVVMAGQSTAKYIEGGQHKYIPYQQLFRRLWEFDVSDLGSLEGYANRDSLKYINTYELGDVKTMIRGTLRFRGFCDAWNTFVQLGCCDDSYFMENVSDLTHRSFISSFLPGSGDVKIQLETRFNASPQTMNALEWSGFFSEERVGLDQGTPAQILEHILNKKWRLETNDRDLIVMLHRIGYLKNGIQHLCTATLTSVGDDSVFTAMAKTVGLPLGIAAKLLLTGKINARGVIVPTTGEFYAPILQELETLGISMSETDTQR